MKDEYKLLLEHIIKKQHTLCTHSNMNHHHTNIVLYVVTTHLIQTARPCVECNRCQAPRTASLPAVKPRHPLATTTNQDPNHSQPRKERAPARAHYKPRTSPPSQEPTPKKRQAQEARRPPEPLRAQQHPIAAPAQQHPAMPQDPKDHPHKMHSSTISKKGSRAKAATTVSPTVFSTPPNKARTQEETANRTRNHKAKTDSVHSAGTSGKPKTTKDRAKTQTSTTKRCKSSSATSSPRKTANQSR